MLGGDTIRVPLVAFLPVQPPPAVHENALVEDQVTIEMLPAVMLAGLAESAAVGCAVPLPNCAKAFDEADSSAPKIINLGSQ